MSSQSTDGANFALVQWDTVGNEPGFRVIIVNRATAEFRESSRIEGCCEELEFNGNQVIVKTASGKKIRIPVG